MKCEEVTYLLPDYLQGQLSDDDMSRVALHLHECKDCPRELASLQQLYARLDVQNVVEPSEHYWNSLLPRVHQRIEDGRKQPLTKWVPRLVFPAVALTLLALIAIQVFSPAPEDGTDGHLRNGMEVRGILQEMDSTEFQRVSVDAFLDNDYALAMNGMNTLSGDKEILKDMLNNLTAPVVLSEYEQRSTNDNLTDEEVDLLLAHLDQTLFKEK